MNFPKDIADKINANWPDSEEWKDFDFQTKGRPVPKSTTEGSPSKPRRDNGRSEK